MEADAPRATSSPPGLPTPLPPEREAVADLLYRSLSVGVCADCGWVLKGRIADLISTGVFDAVRMPHKDSRSSPASFYSAKDSICASPSGSSSSPVKDGRPSTSPASWGSSPDSSFVIRRGHAPNYPSPTTGTPSPVSAQNGGYGGLRQPAKAEAEDDGEIDLLVEEKKVDSSDRVSWEQREKARFSWVGRKKNFMLMERVDGRMVNVLQGLELHTGVFNAKEQKKIVDCVYDLQRLGEAKKLIGRTYSKPYKWMRGKGRVTMQFGCCYNYAVDKDGNPPGVVQDEEVDVLPSLFKLMIKRMVRWHVLPSSCIPNSCIVNIYDEGDCIPPHIDHHDFLRPFCTVSFLSECNILFGSNLKVAGPGEFSGPMAIPLPVGSVLILNGNGADVAKHCVPGVPTKRISITFRKMDNSHLPYTFSPDFYLQDIQPLQLSPTIFSKRQLLESSQRRAPLEQQAAKALEDKNKSFPSQLKAVEGGFGSSFHLEQEDFPALSGSRSTNGSGKSRRPA